jgi:chloramphenicol 3-O-phosphotransferase
VTAPPSIPIRRALDPLPAGDALATFLVHVDRTCECGATYRAPVIAVRCDDCQARIDAAEAERQRQRALVASGIPEEMWWARLDRGRALRARVPDAAVRALLPVLAELVQVAAGERVPMRGTPVVLLAGPAGAGKTSLACALARGAMASPALAGLGRPVVRFLAALEVEQLIRGARWGEEPAAIEQARARPFVVLDDVGQEASEQASTALRAIVAERHARGRATVVTTGLSREELSRRYGGGTLRRLICGGVHVIGAESWGGFGGAP